MAAHEESPLASENERLILDIVRRHEPIPRASITSYTNLTQQSVHRLVEGLTARGLLRAGTPLKGARGQPSPTIELERQAVYSVGISVNTDAVTLSLADFGCGIVDQETVRGILSDRKATLATLAEKLNSVLRRRGISRGNLIGLGFAMSGFFVGADRQFNAPEPLRDWSLIDLQPELEDIFALPVWLENNATTGAIGESLSGVGRWCQTFAYLSFNYGFGGGLILEGRPYLGFHGNAGEFSVIYDAEEKPRRPALQYLIHTLRENGIDIGSVQELKQDFNPSWPGVESWLSEVMPMLERLIATLTGVIDPQAIVFGGQLPPVLGQMMIDRARLPSQRPHRYGAAPPGPRLVLSETKGDASAIGAALLPLKFRYFL
ncbi:MULTISPECIES: ROK family transcriptional regulator [Rhizobium]|uniref:NBD/HSP70 family sugar kinase n=1 Tax=Rhizobium tropici TaxID=398 RepID=A0A6P1CD86_RHITR|nr:MULTISPECIES: ROK family transcriptional regulator [Rhizobium]AGB74900.1 transcriptional regulator, ROK family [Rhizobium tropici CIAT 899]MBB4242080.1 putative NBD/HSP70 family sugar kinase [Rhizobium tropici]MBB5593895.1 putative NBD/HSP70 family sugar kinase [Rhizobium tropici]MBB6492405.1 putative NBD/HSP70 family sugar kinase [Rhizobium tropici]NEV14807.1 ROK family transcriptional regulator [Rhizobium tropici]